MRRKLTICIPWVPDQQCNPNNHRCSERTKVRHRKQGANVAAYPIRVAYQEANEREDGYVLFEGLVVVDLTVRWGYRQRFWDTDNLITAYKYVLDRLQSEAVIENDKYVTFGKIVQERAVQRPETIVTVRPRQPVDPYRAYRELERWLYGGVSQDERI